VPYITIDQDFLSHPKTITISPLAQLLFLRSIIYAGKHLTDGVLPPNIVALLGYDLEQYSYCQLNENRQVIFSAEVKLAHLVGELVNVGGGSLHLMAVLPFMTI
jgi:hypothetical protein